MDAVALAVVKNKDALSISQDSLGIQAQRVATTPGVGRDDGLVPGLTAAAVVGERPLSFG